MIQASDIHGVMAMMPSFATDDANSIHAKDTVNVPELERSVDRAVRDGINVITTTGTFGECHTLLWEEFTTLADATVATVDKRIPVVIGCTSLHTREVLLKMDYAAKAGADAVLVGVPFYFKSSVENAVQFYFDLADEHPELGIFIYHNPRNHHIHIPVSAFKELVTKPNIVGMKDSHRTPMQFMQLMDIVRGKISVMTNQNQMYPYMMMGGRRMLVHQRLDGPLPGNPGLSRRARGTVGRGQRHLYGHGPCGRTGSEPNRSGGRQALHQRSGLLLRGTRQASVPGDLGPNPGPRPRPSRNGGASCARPTRSPEEAAA